MTSKANKHIHHKYHFFILFLGKLNINMFLCKVKT